MFIVGAFVVGVVVTVGVVGLVIVGDAVVVSVQWKTTPRPSTLPNKPL